MALGQAALGERVRFTGRIDRSRMGALYSAADLFAFPGIRESLGMVYLESQSCGLPAVAFRNGGIPEVVRHGETGLLTPPFDAAAFDYAVQTLVGDPEQRRQMGTAARHYVRAAHDLTVNYRLVERCLGDLLERKR
jgi:glycosyltransferase involved in cell wall biosynthesis